jgi:hypothetical protein
VRRTSDGGERSSTAAISVERLGAQIGWKERSGERGVERRRRRRGAFYRVGRRWRGGKEAGGGGVLSPVGFEWVKGKRRWGDVISMGEWWLASSSLVQLPARGGGRGKRRGNIGRAGGGGSGVR